MNTVDMYLQSLGTVLWGRSYDLLEADSYEQAKKFIEELWYTLDEIDYGMPLTPEETHV